MKKHKLKVFDIKNNDINGGSSRYLICHKDAKFQINKKKIDKILRQEKKLKLEDKKSYYRFYKKINLIKNKTKNYRKFAFKRQGDPWIRSINKKVFLQYLQISSKKFHLLQKEIQ